MSPMSSKDVLKDTFWNDFGQLVRDLIFLVSYYFRNCQFQHCLVNWESGMTYYFYQLYLIGNLV